MNSQQSNNIQDAQEWYQQVISACDHHDTMKAYSALHQWDDMVGQLSDQQRNEIMQFKEKLLFTAFSERPIEQAVDVIEKKLLNVLSSEVDINEILKKLYLYLGYGNQEDDRVALRNAALKNQQVLGGKKVFEWLQAFDKAYPPEGVQEAVAGKFFTQYPDITALSKSDQAVLKLLLQVYDEWLRESLTSIFDTMVVYQKLAELKQAGVKEINVKTFARDYFPVPGAPRSRNAPLAGMKSEVFSRETVSLPLLQALPKYENLGNQLITRERIKVKSQSEPVRPSLLYWLKYYRDELGIGQHSSVERGDFLFRSENGKKLSGKERERISLILKSVEENLPLSIDPKNQEIVFPASNAFSLTPACRPAFHDVAISASPTQRGEPGSSPSSESGGLARNDSLMSPRSDSGGLHISRGTSFNIAAPASAMLQRGDPAQTKSARPNVPFGTGEVSFSTGHVFPVEKEAVESRDAPLKNETTLAFQPVSPAAEQGKPVSTPVPAPQPASATFQPASSSASDRSSRDGSLGARGEPNPVSSRSRTLLQKLNSFRIRPVSLGRKDWERGADENHES